MDAYPSRLGYFNTSSPVPSHKILIRRCRSYSALSEEGFCKSDGPHYVDNCRDKHANVNNSKINLANYRTSDISDGWFSSQSDSHVHTHVSGHVDGKIDGRDYERVDGLAEEFVDGLADKLVDGHVNVGLSLQLMPPEILWQIFSHLDGQELIKVSTLCRKLRSISFTPALWRSVDSVWVNKLLSERQFLVALCHTAGKVQNISISATVGAAKDCFYQYDPFPGDLFAVADDQHPQLQQTKLSCKARLKQQRQQCQQHKQQLLQQQQLREQLLRQWRCDQFQQRYSLTASLQRCRNVRRARFSGVDLDLPTIESFCRNDCELREIELSCSQPVCHLFVESITQFNTKLEKLHLFKHNVTDLTPFLKSTTCLRELELTECSNIGALMPALHTLCMLSPALGSTSLVRLAIINYSNLTDEHLRTFAFGEDIGTDTDYQGDGQPDGHSRTERSSSVHWNFQRNFATIRELNLPTLPLLPLAQIESLGAAAQLMHLESLSLSGATFISDDGLLTLVGSLPKLRCLELRDCLQITDNSLAPLVMTTPCLEFLDIDRCRWITDRTMAALQLSECAPRLVHLQISECNLITENVLSALIDACPRLESLVCDNTSISDAFMANLTRTFMASTYGAAKNLSGTDNANANVKCGSFFNLHVFDCANVTAHGICRVLRYNADESRQELGRPMIVLRAFYGWQKLVDAHSRRVLRGDLMGAAKLMRLWICWLRLPQRFINSGILQVIRGFITRSDDYLVDCNDQSLGTLNEISESEFEDTSNITQSTQATQLAWDTENGLYDEDGVDVLNDQQTDRPPSRDGSNEDVLTSPPSLLLPHDDTDRTSFAFGIF